MTLTKQNLIENVSKNLRVECVFVDESVEYIFRKHAVSKESDFMCSLTIKRSDREPIRTWRVLQDIKNAIIGKDLVAIEIYRRVGRGSTLSLLYNPSILLQYSRHEKVTDE